jgi:hypothetical protein
MPSYYVFSFVTLGFRFFTTNLPSESKYLALRAYTVSYRPSLWRKTIRALFPWLKSAYRSMHFKRLCFNTCYLSPLRLMSTVLPPRSSSTWFCKSKWFVSHIYRRYTGMQNLDIKLSIWNSEAKGSVDIIDISYVENSSPYNIIPAWRYDCHTMRPSKNVERGMFPQHVRRNGDVQWPARSTDLFASTSFGGTLKVVSSTLSRASSKQTRKKSRWPQKE